MGLRSRHTTTGNGSTVGSFVATDTSFVKVTVINRSTNDIYWTSSATQGTAGDGVPTITGNNTFIATSTAVPSTCIYSVVVGAAPGVFAGGQQSVTVSWICTVTNSPFSIVLE